MLTPRQLEILQHALGLDEYGRFPRNWTDYTRNHFAAGAGDEPSCRELISLGYMKEHARTGTFPYFNCSPKPPKLTRSQRRYRDFLDADSGLSFGEWMKLKASAEAAR